MTTETMRYAIWNNKGGVGKTFLTFMLSSEYAIKHENKKIVVVDMCPQANLSEILLGGNGPGSEKLEQCIKEKKTIGEYINLRIESPHQKLGRETDFFINVYEFNKEIPKNLYLIVGDPQLEIQAQVMNQISSQDLPENSWKNVHSWLIDLIIAGEKKHGNTTTFIDCNPSFSSYTEIALLAAMKIIIPCSSDGSSARAIDNVASLVYGQNLPENLKSASFFTKAKKFGMSLPVIHSVLLNRSTQYDKKASKAFGAMFKEIKNRVERFKDSNKQWFHSHFEYFDIPDAHSPAIVCSHKGLPISKLKAGHHKVHKTMPQVNPEPLKRYKEAIKKLVNVLN